MGRGRYLFGSAHRISHDASAHTLKGRVVGNDAAEIHALKLGLVAQNRIFDQRCNFIERFVLVVVGINVNNEEVFVMALVRLMACQTQMLASVELGRVDIAILLYDLIHDRLPMRRLRFSCG